MKKILDFLFFWRSKDTLSSYQKQSAGIFEVFTKTQQQCLTVNAKIYTLVDKKKQDIEALQNEVAELNIITESHKKLHGKINAFITG